MENQMTIEEFGRSIKAKYPQYGDMPDADVGRRMLQKYPQYADMVRQGQETGQASAYRGETPRPSGLRGAVDAAANTINRFTDVVNNAPVLKQIGQAVGGALAVPSAVIGGAAAAIGNPVVNIASGRPVFEGWGSDVVKNAKDTGKFSYELGRNLPAALVQQTLGRVPNAILGAAQTYSGAEQAMNAPDTAGRIEGAVNAGLGLFGLFGASGKRVGTVEATKGEIMSKPFVGGTRPGVVESSPGLLLNREPIKRLSLEARAKANGSTPHEIAISDAGKAMDEVFGTSARNERRILGRSMAGQETKSMGRIAAEHGVVPEQNANGTFEMANAMRDVDAKSSRLDDILQANLQDEQPRISLEDARRAAINDIRSREGMANLAKERAVDEINRYVDSEIQRNGGLVTDRTANAIKRGFYKESYDKGVPTSGQDGLRSLASKLMSRIEEVNADINVKKINGMLGELAQLRQFLKEKQGMAIGGGKLTKKFNQVIGAMVGSHFGPFGTLAGAEIGDALTGYANDPYVRSMAVQRGLDLSGFKRPQQELANEIFGQMQSRQQAQMSRPRLPAPKTPESIIYAEPTPTVQPTQAEIVRTLRERGWQGPLTQEEIGRARAAVQAKIDAENALRGPSTPLLPPGAVAGMSPNDYRVERGRSALRELDARNASILETQRNAPPEPPKKRIAGGVSRQSGKKRGK